MKKIKVWKRTLLAALVATSMVMTSVAPVMAAEGTEDVVGDADSGLTAPTNVQWETGDKTGIFHFTPTCKGYYTARISGPLIDDYNQSPFGYENYSLGAIPRDGDSLPSTSDGNSSYEIGESGTYTVQIKVSPDDSNSSEIWNFDKGVVTEPVSFYYSAPDQKLGIPQNLAWSTDNKGTVSWDTVPNASAYSLVLYRSPVGKDEYKPYHSVGGYFTDVSPSRKSEDLTDYLGDNDQYNYKFAVRAISGDLTQYKHGDLSQLSDPLNAEQVVKGLTDTVKDGKKELAENATPTKADEALSVVKASDSLSNIQLAMQTDTTVRQEISEFETSYTKAKGITVKKPEVEDGLKIDGNISTVGAGLNADSGEVQLKVSKISDNPIYDKNIYKNSIEFGMDLTGANKADADGNLYFPVTVTMKVPEGLRADITLVVLHFVHTTKSFESVPVRINSDGTISFTLLHFSDFVLANKTDGTKPTETPTPTPTTTPGANPSTTPTPTPTVTPKPSDTPAFTDVPADKYYAEAVKWAVDNKITSGTSTTTFSPNATCTRGQIVTLLYKKAGSPNVSDVKMPFTDVKAGSYYENAVKWAVKNKITTGTSVTTFSPNAACTRGQIVTFLYKASTHEDVAADSLTFTDVDMNAYYATPVAWALLKNITGGTSKTTFSPNDPCTRAQAVTFLYRAK